MSAKIIDGQAIAAAVREEWKGRVDRLRLLIANTVLAAEKLTRVLALRSECHDQYLVAA